MTNAESNPEARLAGYFARYEPAIARLGKALRARLRARLPGLSEVVYLYENQDALVIAYSPTGRGYDAPCSLGLYPSGVKLFFGQGAELSRSDPNRLLQGSGKTVRHVVLNALRDFDRAEIQALVSAALTLAKLRPTARAKGQLILKAEAQKQRARRAKKASTRRTPSKRPGGSPRP